MLILELLEKRRLLKEKRTKYVGRFYEDFLEPMITNKNDKQLKKKLRVTSKSFNYITDLVYRSNTFSFWQEKNTKNTYYVPVAKQVALFLYFLSRNNFYDDIADYFGLGGSNTVSIIIERVSKAIIEYKSVFIKGHTEETKRQMLLDANDRGFTHCIGIIDGVVNTITNFDKEFPHSWTTRKSVYAIVSMVICDIRGNILWYSTGHCGSRNDRGIFKSDVLPAIDEITNSIQY